MRGAMLAGRGRLGRLAGNRLGGGPGSGGGSGLVVTAILTNPTDTKTGATTATLTVDTDVSNGTLYSVVTTSATNPTKAQVKAGQDHLGAAAAFAGSQAVVATGTQSVSATGLTSATTYFAHFMQESGGGAQSIVVAGDGFTTD